MAAQFHDKFSKKGYYKKAAGADTNTGKPDTGRAVKIGTATEDGESVRKQNNFSSKNISLL